MFRKNRHRIYFKIYRDRIRYCYTCRLYDGCKLLQGNLRARKRIDAINDLLNETGMGSDCVWFIQIDNKNKTESIISELANCIRQIINVQEKATETF